MSVALAIEAPRGPWGKSLRHVCSKECRERAFWALVDWSGGPEACWLFRGPVNKAHEPGHSGGYGQFCHGGVHRPAHRESLIITGKLKPRSKRFALHKVGCLNKNCVNPNHLYAGTALDNARDQVKAGTSNLGKTIPNGPVVTSLLDVSGKGEDWGTLRYDVPAFALNGCAGCNGVGFRTTEDKVRFTGSFVPRQFPEFEYAVTGCQDCRGTGLVRGGEVSRAFVRTDREDIEPLDALLINGGGWGSLFDKEDAYVD